MNKSGAIVFFPYLSPQMFQGLDTLKLGSDNNITIGDGRLFSQPFQNIANSDLSNEYGSCESLRGVINTPNGLYYISQAQGKIFHYGGKGLDPISNNGMKWWFNKYLPSQLIKQFPELEGTVLADNPVVGVGCQTIYDPNDDTVYFMKKDYKVKSKFNTSVTYDSDRGFLDGLSPIILGDPIYFDDASWTISYDPKSKAWISFHDWHPELALPSINHFFTTKTITTTIPQCPPGYTFNNVSGLCEIVINTTEPSNVTVEDLPATISGGAQECLIDIVICIDASGSTGGPVAGSGSLGDAELLWLVAFIDDPSIQALLVSGAMQIGFQVWGTFSAIGDPTGTSESMLNAVTGAQARLWYFNNWVSVGGTTNPQVARTNGLVQLNDKSNSALAADYPTRSASPFFKQILIVVTDGTTISSGPTTLIPQSFNGLQSANVIPGATGPLNQELMSVFVGPNANLPNPTILDQITVGAGAGPANTYYGATGVGIPGPNQFTMRSDLPATLTATAQAIVGVLCGVPIVCTCQAGYTLVYPNPATGGLWTESSGVCDNITPPICRKVTCACPPTIIPGTVTTELGICPDTFPGLGQIGDPNWVNPTPPLCNYFFSLQTPPNYNVGSFWRHNYRCDSFANFYDQAYPWEVELVANTGQTVNTLRSIEYQLEVYVYKGDLHDACGDDKWEDLDFNFDRSVIYNNEQVSGLLTLVPTPFNNPILELTYPIITTNNINILCSKVEQKYRFNQFWDITNDRGEFTNAQQPIWDTELNGYIKNLNPINLNYFKSPLQHKKFRNYFTNVILRRNSSSDRKMLLRLNNTKLLTSLR